MADRFALKARYVFPVSGRPIADGCVSIRGERIEAVGAPAGDCPIRDLGNAAIVPGLVNAHTHLEFADLAAPLGRPGMALPDWIRLVMDERRATAQPASARVMRGLEESVRGGVTAVGEIATHDCCLGLSNSQQTLDLIAFHESIAPTELRIESALADARSFLTIAPRTPHVRPALSPHAPYTVHRRLLASLVELSRRFNVPMAMHLAESREELELLRSGSGPFRELLADLKVWEPNPAARHATILEYLKQLARAPRALVIHGNYLTDEEIGFLADHSDSMSVVYCPRTHAYFRHKRYRLARMLDRGVHVALGTDSRASNPNLSVFDEMRFVAALYPELPPARVLELATRSGARALGLDDMVGTLEAGKLASLAVVALGDDAQDPHEMLLATGTQVLQTWIRGQLAFDAH